jgi:hypothetical protein
MECRPGHGRARSWTWVSGIQALALDHVAQNSVLPSFLHGHTDGLNDPLTEMETVMESSGQKDWGREDEIWTCPI